MKIVPCKNTVLVDHIQKGSREIGGIYLLNDNGKSSGIRSRWCRVYAVGDGVTDVSPGQWVYVVHGKWTRGTTLPLNDDPENLQTLWKVDYPDNVLGVSDEEPEDNNFSEF